MLHSVLREDLQASLGVWWITPLLPVLSVMILAGLNALPGEGSGGLIVAFLRLLGIGWQGTERLWYRQIFEGTGVSVSELWLATWRYFVRYLLLGLLLLVVLVPAFIWRAIEGELTPAISLAMSVSLAAAGVLVTFVLPALAFTTPRVHEAVRIGLRILREDWPQCRWYALFPAVAFLVAGRLSVLETAVPGLVWTALATVVSVAFDGAVVRYYLRRQAAAR